MRCIIAQKKSKFGSLLQWKKPKTIPKSWHKMAQKGTFWVNLLSALWRFLRQVILHFVSWYITSAIFFLHYLNQSRFNAHFSWIQDCFLPIPIKPWRIDLRNPIWHHPWIRKKVLQSINTSPIFFLIRPPSTYLCTVQCVCCIVNWKKSMFS